MSDMTVLSELDAVVVDPVTGTVLGNEVRAIPADVWNENAAFLDGASDSEIASFAERYGVPVWVQTS